MSPVTTHAIVRWLERVRGVDFRRCPGGFDEAERAAWGCRRLEISIDEARAEILPDRLRRLLELRPHAIRAHDRTLVVEGGRVVTCLGRGGRTLSVGG